MKRVRLATLAFIGGILLGASLGSARADELSDRIDALLDFVRKSPCTFIRNGSEYAGPAAADHVQAKYEHYKDQIHSVDDFIDKAATKSMLSGEPYQVRCPGEPTMPAADWLRAEAAALP